MKTAIPEPATVKAVIAYAEKLDRAADRQIAGDPYADPYRPPGPEGARKLCQRLAKARIAALSDDATEEERATAAAQGPADALELLRLKAAEADREAREQALLSQRALERHARRQATHRRSLHDRRLELSPGQRIDQAIAGLVTVSTVQASTLDGDRVHGGELNQAPQWGGDPAGGARSKAVKLAVELEEALDSARARDLRSAA